MEKLQRKTLRNVMNSVAKVKNIKRLNSKPVLVNIDVQAIKESFRQAKKA
jgi:hypothetical protein